MGKTRWIVVTATSVAAAFSTWILAGWGGEFTVCVVTNVSFVMFAVFATVCAVLAARGVSGRKRHAWTFIGIGLAGRLRDYGCDVAQGFHFSLPLSVAEIGDLLRGLTLREPVSSRWS